MKLGNTIAIGKEVILMNLIPSRRVPLSVHIGLTNRCPGRCRYCRFDRLSCPDFWTTEDLLKVLQEMRTAGTRRVQFTGGEPMLRKDVGIVLDRAKSLGMFAGISTNGFQVPERVNELVPADVVQVSYDGPQKAHDYLRGEGSHQTALAALDALQAKGIATWTNTVLTTVNAPCIDEIIEHARSRKILANFVLLDHFEEPQAHFHPARKEIADLVLTGEERRSALERLIELKRAAAPVGGSLPYLENALSWPGGDDVTSPAPSPLYRCWAGKATAHLEADGKLYSCGMGVGRVEGVDVRDIGFAEAWKIIKPLPECRSCTMACGVEANLLFSLNMGSIMNWVRQLR
ncbi:MAG: radical SAM protein [PVC group bacterium]